MVCIVIGHFFKVMKPLFSTVLCVDDNLSSFTVAGPYFIISKMSYITYIHKLYLGIMYSDMVLCSFNQSQKTTWCGASLFHVERQKET
jgi:hypothetical protein